MPARPRPLRSRAAATARSRPALVEEHAADALKLRVVLARAAAAIDRRTAADVARHGLTVAEFGALEVLYHRGPLLLGELQRHMLVSSGGTTFLVDRLAKKGYVERRECERDRRARYAALTSKGEALIRRIFPAHAEAVTDAVSGLSPSEQRTATALLRKLGRAAAGLDPAAAESVAV